MSPALALSVVAAGLAATGAVDLMAEMVAARGRRVRHARGIRMLARLGGRLGRAIAPPGNLTRRIEAAGTPRELDSGDVMAIKGGAALVALAVAAPLALVLPGRMPLLALVALPALGFLGPDVWLRRRIARRARAMELELPDVLDLLRVALEAGLPLGRAAGPA